jgi:hypothetical protein
VRSLLHLLYQWVLSRGGVQHAVNRVGDQRQRGEGMPTRVRRSCPRFLADRHASSNGTTRFRRGLNASSSAPSLRLILKGGLPLPAHPGSSRGAVADPAPTTAPNLDQPLRTNPDHDLKSNEVLPIAPVSPSTPEAQRRCHRHQQPR